MPKVHNKPIKRPRKGSNKESKRHPERHPGLAHRTVRCASGATATSRATVDCNALNARLRAQRTNDAQLAHRTVYRTCPVHHRTAQRPHKLELQRSNPNGLLTWLAHRTVSPVRHTTAHFQRAFLVVGAINTPTTPHSMASKFLHFYTLQELYHSDRKSTRLNSSHSGESRMPSSA